MGLKALIKRIEKNEWREKDYEYLLARAILEELVQGENLPDRKALFLNIRKLPDQVIEDYIRLNTPEKRQMAQNYTLYGKELNNISQYKRLKEITLKG